MKSLNLLNKDKNSKTIKGQKQGYKTAVLYLAPSALTWQVYSSSPKKFRQDFKKRYGFHLPTQAASYLKKNICPFAHKDGCLNDCLNKAGRGAFDSIQWARALKTAFYLVRPEQFKEAIKHELKTYISKNDKDGFKTAFRLNGTSDLRELQFIREVQDMGAIAYDYSKDFKKFEENTNKEYSLTFSIQNRFDFHKWKNSGMAGNCAIVTKDGIFDPILATLPDFKRVHFVDGDEHDLRFLDPQGKFCVVLKAKGPARKSKSNFLVNNWSA